MLAIGYHLCQNKQRKNKQQMDQFWNQSTMGSMMMFLLPVVAPAPSRTNVLAFTTSSSQLVITRKVPTMLTQVRRAYTRTLVVSPSLLIMLAWFKQYQQVFRRQASDCSMHRAQASVGSTLGLLERSMTCPSIVRVPSSASQTSTSPSSSLRVRTKGSMLTGSQLVCTSAEYPLPNLTRVLTWETLSSKSHEAMVKKVPTMFLWKQKIMSLPGRFKLPWNSRLAFRRQYQYWRLISCSIALEMATGSTGLVVGCTEMC